MGNSQYREVIKFLTWGKMDIHKHTMNVYGIPHRHTIIQLEWNFNTVHSRQMMH